MTVMSAGPAVTSQTGQLYWRDAQGNQGHGQPGPLGDVLRIARAYRFDEPTRFVGVLGIEEKEWYGDDGARP